MRIESILSAVLLTVLVWTPSAAADGPVAGPLDGRWPVGSLVEQVPDGYIDWTSGRIFAWGRLKPIERNAMHNVDAVREEGTLRVARERLREILATLRLGNDLTLESRAGGSEAADRFAEGAGKVKQRVRRGELLEILVSAPLYGKAGYVSHLEGAGSEAIDTGPSPPPAKSRKRSKKPTGVIIDARGTGVKPALFPRLVAETGQPVWSPEDLAPRVRILRAVASYGRILRTPMEEPSMVDWQRNQVLSRMGERPAIFRATAAAGSDSCDPVLQGEAAERLSSDKDLRELLARGHLVIVVD